MKKLLKLLKKFEERRGVSIQLTIYADGSYTLKESWDDSYLFFTDNIKYLKKFLKEEPL